MAKAIPEKAGTGFSSGIASNAKAIPEKAGPGFSSGIASNAKAIMIQGTGSDVGKSLIVAGLCRLFVRRGLNVRPFKPQNMSNNAAVTLDGGEIGRAQALQARACGVPPSVHMNPVLLKPQSEVGAQVIVQGKVLGNAKAKEFQGWKPKLLSHVLESFTRLKGEADLVIIEGAGSAAEVNLRDNDIANMGFARAADVPVILLGDIDRGGVIAQIVGTKAVITEDDAAQIKGFIVNRFRGDPSLFDAGMSFIADRTGWAPIGLLPFFSDAFRLPAEDALALDHFTRARQGEGLRIIVPVLPSIANFDDLDPLRLEPGISVELIRRGTPLPASADLVLLPGSKATLSDLASFRAESWDIDLAGHIRRGGRVLGLCGGYQMLGETIADPEGLEGPPGKAPGLGHLAVSTVLKGPKSLKAVSGHSLADHAPFTGYEMHMGVTKGEDCARPLLAFDDGRQDGAVSQSGLVMGTYAHGLFADDAQRAAWLKRLGAAPSSLAYESEVERVLDALAAHLEKHLDIEALLRLAR